MGDNNEPRITETYNLRVAVGFDYEDGMEFGALGILNELYKEVRSQEYTENMTDEQVLGQILQVIVTQYADTKKGYLWSEGVWIEAQQAARDRYRAPELEQ